MALRQVAVAVALAAMASAADAQVFRCTDARGGITFQEHACPVTSDEIVTTIPTSYPEANTRERERLLARADAADARLLRRLEIESMERIAREQRLAQEAAAKAEREARAAESYPLAVYGVPYAPYGRVRHHGASAGPPNLRQLLGFPGR